MTLLLKKISLTNFRNYEAQRLDTEMARLVVLSGPNGAGKTNILEAASLLAPGKGIRGAELGALSCQAPVQNLSPVGPSPLWAVAAELQNAQGHVVRIGTGLDRKDDGAQRRIVRIDGKEAASQAALSNHVAAVWLTPQMDRLFLEGAAARRRFLDRLVFAYTPDHVTHLNRYEKNMRQRLKILTGPAKPDPRWLEKLEQQMAADAVSVVAARQYLLTRLSTHLSELAAAQSLFPVPAIALSGDVQSDLLKKPAVTVEAEWQERFYEARRRDAEIGRTTTGAHRTDLDVRYALKNMAADQCSTGEQKGLLVSIILAHALMMQAEKGFVPLLLLDEVAAHLDEARRTQLFQYLLALNGQVWLTGTDADIFKSIQPQAKMFSVVQGQVNVQRDMAVFGIVS